MQKFGNKKVNKYMLALAQKSTDCIAKLVNFKWEIGDLKAKGEFYTNEQSFISQLGYYLLRDQSTKAHHWILV